MPGEKKDVELVDLLGSQDTSLGPLLWIGRFIAVALRDFGIVTVFVGDDGCVRTVSPTEVYLTPGALDEVEEGDIEWLRPIVSDGKPRVVAWRDGEPWEVRVRPKSES